MADSRTPLPPLVAQLREAIAAAIANARGGRRGAPPISNILALLPANLREEVLDDADAVIEALRERGLGQALAGRGK